MSSDDLSGLLEQIPFAKRVVEATGVFAALHGLATVDGKSLDMPKLLDDLASALRRVSEERDSKSAVLKEWIKKANEWERSFRIMGEDCEIWAARTREAEAALQCAREEQEQFFNAGWDAREKYREVTDVLNSGFRVGELKAYSLRARTATGAVVSQIPTQEASEACKACTRDPILHALIDDLAKVAHHEGRRAALREVKAELESMLGVTYPDMPHSDGLIAGLQEVAIRVDQRLREVDLAGAPTDIPKQSAAEACQPGLISNPQQGQQSLDRAKVIRRAQNLLRRLERVHSHGRRDLDVPGSVDIEQSIRDLLALVEQQVVSHDEPSQT